MTPIDGNGWTVYEKLVLAEIEELKKELSQAHEDIILLRIDLATLRVKAGMWGAIAGLIPASIGAIAAVSGIL